MDNNGLNFNNNQNQPGAAPAGPAIGAASTGAVQPAAGVAQPAASVGQPSADAAAPVDTFDPASFAAPNGAPGLSADGMSVHVMTDNIFAESAQPAQPVQQEKPQPTEAELENKRQKKLTTSIVISALSALIIGVGIGFLIEFLLNQTRNNEQAVVTAESTAQANFMKKINIQKIDDYLYTADFTGVTYTTADGEAFFESQASDKLGRALFSDELDSETGSEAATQKIETTIAFPATKSASLQHDLYRGYNLDAAFDEVADILVHTAKTATTYETYGFASSTVLTNDYIQTSAYNEEYEHLVYYVMDGINEEGLIVTTNTVNGDDAAMTTGTNADGEKLATNLLARYLLDYAADIDTAILLIQKLDLYALQLNGVSYEYQWMISDETGRTISIEIVDNQVQILEGQNILTNYYIYNGPNQYAIGIERYNILAENQGSATNTNNIYNIMRKINYTNAYNTEYAWRSEANSKESIYGDLNINSEAASYDRYLQDAASLFEKRARNDEKTMQTRRTVIYDAKNLEITVAVQEKNLIHQFKF